MKGGLNSMRGSKISKIFLIPPPFSGGRISKDTKVCPFELFIYSVTFKMLNLIYLPNLSHSQNLLIREYFKFATFRLHSPIQALTISPLLSQRIPSVLRNLLPDLFVFYQVQNIWIRDVRNTTRSRMQPGT